MKYFYKKVKSSSYRRRCNKGTPKLGAVIIHKTKEDAYIEVRTVVLTGANVAVFFRKPVQKILLRTSGKILYIDFIISRCTDG
jgi:hypothetical protein